MSEYVFSSMLFLNPQIPDGPAGASQPGIDLSLT